MAIIALRNRSEIEFLKTMTIVKTIIEVGNRISSAIVGDNSSSGDGLNKAVELLREGLLPHLKEETHRKAEDVKATLEKEMTRGPLTIKVVGSGKKRR